MATVKCDLCGYTSHYLVPHLAEVHNLEEEDYAGGPVVSPELEAAYEAHCKGKKREAFNPKNGVKVTFAGVEMPVTLDVPADACLPLPLGYKVPEHGKLADDIRRVVVRIHAGNSKPVWCWGPPGTGKDAVFAALSNLTRRPCMQFNIAPDVDISAWVETRAFSEKGTYWEEGPLLKALRDGYTTPSGRKVPYLIVLSDLDRANRSQMEPLRAILDSLGGKIQSSSGMHRVLPGTLVVATANTSGGGDTSGRYTATAVDTSVLDRFTFKVQFHNMDSRDEEPILRAKYPDLSARFPDLVGTVMRSITAIRDAVEKEELFLDFGHRSVCNWLDATNAEATCNPKVTESSRVLRAGLQDILAGCPNEDTREALKRLVDPHIKGGAVDEGDTSHIRKDPLSP
jgi:MoxR-like ATPase